MARITVDPEREQAELEQYLGEDYDHARLVRWQEAVDEELAQTGDEQLLYRSSRMYLYNLTAFAMTHTKEPYLRDLTALVPSGARLLDYGCGIGSDGLLLLEAGYGVGFADFANPSVEYLRWRLRRHPERVGPSAAHAPAGQPCTDLRPRQPSPPAILDRARRLQREGARRDLVFVPIHTRRHAPPPRRNLLRAKQARPGLAPVPA